MLEAEWPLVGRDAELGRLLSLVDAPGCHALVLSGAPGVGNTRLAAELSLRIESLGIEIVRIAATQTASALLLLCFFGGVLAASAEPVVDMLSGLYFPHIGQNTAFSNFGRHIPWALVFAYPWYVGGQGYLAYQQFNKRVPGTRIWQMWGLFAVTNALVETPGVLTGFHVYYGNQPLNFWGFPLWAAAVQSIMPMVAGALIYMLRSHVGDSWKLLAVIPLVPMADGLVNAAFDIPMWTTLGNNMSLGANYVGAALTIGMAALGVWLLTATLGHHNSAERPLVDMAPAAARTSG